ncbi:MAG: hypothetical protein V4632_19085 [Pseudomonadota bacterium]
MFRILLLALLIASPTHAIAIYKCESNGETLYTDARCPGGKLPDLRERVRNNPPLSVTAVKAETARAKQEASRLQEQRHMQEAMELAQRQRLAFDDYIFTKKCVALALRKRWADEEAQLASGFAGYQETEHKTRRIARAVNEKYELECAG